MTRLPSSAPAPYARSQLGPNVLRWMRAKGWIDHRYVHATAAYQAPQLADVRRIVRETV
jgi:hypothetical protein